MQPTRLSVPLNETPILTLVQHSIPTRSLSIRRLSDGQKVRSDGVSDARSRSGKLLGTVRYLPANAMATLANSLDRILKQVQSEPDGDRLGLQLTDTHRMVADGCCDATGASNHIKGLPDTT